MQSNYPPGVTGNEPEITGQTDPGEARMTLANYDGRYLALPTELSVTADGPGLSVTTVIVELGRFTATFPVSDNDTTVALAFLAELDSADPSDIGELFDEADGATEVTFA